MFDSDFMKKLEYLSLVSRRVFRGLLLARRRTRQLGGGVEFAGHREYLFGDDLRHLDWNFYARSGNRFIKRFEEEEDLHVYLFLDCSRSMRTGDPDKFDYARQITAALAYIALSDLDRVSVVAYSDRIREIFPLTRGKEHIVNLLRFLEHCQSDGDETNLGKVINDFVHRKQRSGLAFVISDLFDKHGFQPGLDLLRCQQFEPGIIQIHDDSEAEPSLRGDFRVIDIESGQKRNITFTEAMLKQYRKRFTGFLEQVKKYCVGNGFVCTISRTSVPFDELILRMMRETGGVR
ncbi:MAG: DUF58 domain-containing protein [Planctomycetaceae bacterium]|jgi:uncharacterized protein (DUF58 family)|nr:DUF58 domain-containing protein [Planctomycetaceae bacterium]